MSTNQQRQFLQCTAALTMLIDHIGVLFFPTVLGFRAIGRLSFPLFAFGIAEGVSHTHDFWRYFRRLLLTAVLSQPIYQMVFGLQQGNPLFTLAWGAAVLYCHQNGKGGWTALLLAGSFLGNISYGWYGVWSIFFFGFYQKRESLCFYGELLLTGLYSFFTGVWLQLLSLFSFAFLEGNWRIRALCLSFPRYFFYCFYPLHLLVLGGIKQLL